VTPSSTEIHKPLINGISRAAGTRELALRIPLINVGRAGRARLPRVTEPSPPLLVGATATVVVGTVLDLFALLLLPFRVNGHLVPLSALLAFVFNALLGWASVRLLESRLPARLLLGLVVVLSLVAASRGPGGDVFVTRDLQGMFLLYVIAAALGASVPLIVRRPR
jgi:hypothetical protein